MLDTLPAEIRSHILSFLHNDIQSLTNSRTTMQQLQELATEELLSSLAEPFVKQLNQAISTINYHFSSATFVPIEDQAQLNNLIASLQKKFRALYKNNLNQFIKDCTEFFDFLKMYFQTNLPPNVNTYHIQAVLNTFSALWAKESISQKDVSCLFNLFHSDLKPHPFMPFYLWLDEYTAILKETVVPHNIYYLLYFAYEAQHQELFAGLLNNLGPKTVDYHILSRSAYRSIIANNDLLSLEKILAAKKTDYLSTHYGMQQAINTRNLALFECLLKQSQDFSTYNEIFTNKTSHNDSPTCYKCLLVQMLEHGLVDFLCLTAQYIDPWLFKQFAISSDTKTGRTYLLPLALEINPSMIPVLLELGLDIRTKDYNLYQLAKNTNSQETLTVLNGAILRWAEKTQATPFLIAIYKQDEEVIENILRQRQYSYDDFPDEQRALELLINFSDQKSLALLNSSQQYRLKNRIKKLESTVSTLIHRLDEIDQVKETSLTFKI